MAVVERTIIAGGGGDYTTIAAWEAATNLNSGADIWKGVISDNSDYDEAVVIDAAGATPTSYPWLTVAAANRHTGAWDTGKARMVYTGGNTAAIQTETALFRIDGLQIARTSGAGGSDEGIRLTNEGTLVGSRLLIGNHDTTGLNDTDGIYMTVGTTLYLDNSVVHGWNRGCIHVQSISGSGDVDIFLDWVTLLFGGESGEGSNEEAPLAVRSTTGDITVTAYNSIFQEQNSGLSPDDVFARTSAGDTATFNGSHNCWDSMRDLAGTLVENWTDKVTASAGVATTDTANAVIITDTTRATFDATPQNLANNVILGAGVDRQGNEPHPFQDFSTDIAGNTRPTTDVDIGAHQVTAGATGPNAGTTTVPVDLLITAAGAANHFGTATVTLELVAVADGQASRSATASAAIDLAVAATGSAPATANEGTAALPVELDVAATGSTEQSGLTSFPLELVVEASGSSDHSGTAAVTLDVAVAANGDTPHSGTATTAIDVAVTATGTVDHASAVALPIDLSIDAVGAAPGLGGFTSVPIDIAVAVGGATDYQAAAVIEVDLLVSAEGSSPNAGTATVAIDLTLTATGDAPAVGVSDGIASYPLELVVTAVGEAPIVPAAGTAALLLDVGVAAAGTTERQGTATTPIGLIVAATGSNGEGPTIGFQVFDGATLRSIASIEMHDGATLRDTTVTVGTP